MDLDQEVCLCFHVSRRKLESFIRHERPQRASQLTECYGAGTGCKWCIRYLNAIFEAANRSDDELGEDTVSGMAAFPTANEYAAMRHQYRRDQRGNDQSDTRDDSDGVAKSVRKGEGGADDRSNEAAND